MFDNWQNLEENCLKCTSCGLHKTRNNVVFGVGNINSEVMFVGEGPGEQEDLKAEPFVGRSGKLLDEMLKSINLDRKKNIYIANIVKCRPNQNRDPLPEEQELCIPWLKNQFVLMKPKIIVTLGRISSIRIIKFDLKITKEHGKVFVKNNVFMIPTFHPAAILRNPNFKPQAIEDFKTLQKVIEKNCEYTY